MDSPTVWNVNDKFDYLSVNSDGLEVSYTGEKYFVPYLLFLYDM